MMNFKRIFIFSVIGLLLFMELSTLVAQERYSILTGTVVGIRLRRWLDVESENDKAIINFRIGHSTRYTPHRYPYVGEKVKVEYLTQQGVPIAYSVTILEGAKATQEMAPKRSIK
jgi:hypothetical protein